MLGLYAVHGSGGSKRNHIWGKRSRVCEPVRTRLPRHPLGMSCIRRSA